MQEKLEKLVFTTISASDIEQWLNSLHVVWLVTEKECKIVLFGES